MIYLPYRPTESSEALSNKALYTRRCNNFLFVINFSASQGQSMASQSRVYIYSGAKRGVMCNSLKFCELEKEGIFTDYLNKTIFSLNCNA
jgi:hypothetical protein